MALTVTTPPKLPEPRLVSTHEYKVNPTKKVIVEEYAVMQYKRFYGGFDENGNEQPAKPETCEIRMLDIDLQKYVIDQEEEGTGIWKSVYKTQNEFPKGMGRGFIRETIDSIVNYYRQGTEII